MTRFTQHDRHLWDVLIAVVVSERITDVARIHKCAKRAARAVIPEGWRFTSSCFYVLAKDGATLRGGEAAARAALRVHAEACRAVLLALDEGRPVAPGVVIGVNPTSSRVAASSSPASGEVLEGGRRFRADLDG